MPSVRTRPDRCPGVLRPWPAADGMLVRLRLIGGRIGALPLRGLSQIAQEYGDGRIHLTARANLQLRAMPAAGADLARPVVDALEATGLLPSRTHELVRNVMVSPQTGLAGGRADLRGPALALDRMLCADPVLAGLPGRFLFVLDDGRGDLVDRDCDLGLVALGPGVAQLRIGEQWGAVVELADAPRAVMHAARCFLDNRGEGPDAAWHVRELDRPLRPTQPPDPRVPLPTGPLGYGRIPGGHHVAVGPHGLGRDDVQNLTDRSDQLVVTPWRGVLVPAST